MPGAGSRTGGCVGPWSLADKGVVETTREGWQHTSAPSVEVLDSTAAGDAFAGHLGAGLAGGLAWDACVQQALHAGALAVTKRGASPSLPTREEVERFMHGLG